MSKNIFCMNKFCRHHDYDYRFYCDADRKECAERNSLPRKSIPESHILKYFKYEHLPEKLRTVSKTLCILAKEFDQFLPDCAEKAAGLRKLLEAKDCFVRANLEKENNNE